MLTTLFIAFLFQEPISSSAILLYVYQNGASIWTIHFLFLLATSIDIVIGYFLGKLIFQKYHDSKIGKYISMWVKKMEVYQKSKSSRFILFIIAIAVFPVSSLFMPWFRISLARSFVLLLIGEIVFWYSITWLTVLGVNDSVVNPAHAIIAVVIVSVCLNVVFNFFRRKFVK